MWNLRNSLLYRIFLRLENDSFVRSSEVDSTATANNGDGEEASSLPLRKKRYRRRVTHHDFVIITPSSSAAVSGGGASESQSASSTTTTKPHTNATNPTIPQPLHLETAAQLGLMSDPSIPPLISSLLTDMSPSASRRFLRRWLLIPPPPEIVNAMAQLVGVLKDGHGWALPVTSMNKVTSLIRAGQASAAVYRDIVHVLDAACDILLMDERPKEDLAFKILYTLIVIQIDIIPIKYKG